ncbi:hypothetical protein GCM10009433_16030 [Psychroflexus lacisalsi]|uniref:DUF3575 domain-containing protein n=1 Tax=Psychroflexus lacisalsi TaxID=503928 RepID=A0ABP3VIL4_9FLAO
MPTKAQQYVESWDGTPNLERHQFTLNLLGIRYELGLFKNVSISSSLAPGLATYEEGYSFGLAWHTRVRYYHNFKKRYNFGMEVVGNSANYFGPARTLFWEPLQLADNLNDIGEFSLAFYGGVYGWQRTNKKGFNTTFEIGLGYYDGIGVSSGFGPLLNFTFGWVATNRKSKKVIKVN